MTQQQNRNRQFDICFVCINELRNDARTLNIARTYIKAGKSLCIIATGEENEIEAFAKEGITFFPVAKSSAARAWKRILGFSTKARKYKSKAKAQFYWASDIYSLFVAREFARLKERKLIYDSREIYSALGPLHKSPLKQKLQNLWEKRLIRYVDKIVVSGKLDAEYLDSYFKFPAEYKVIMNLPLYKDKAESNLIREKFAIPEDMKIIIYQGMIFEGRGLLPVLKAMEYLPKVIFCIFGEGGYRQFLEETAQKLGVSNRLIFCGKVDYDDLHQWTCSADLGINFIEPITLSYELALPNKLFEYCMARIPVISSDLPAIKEIYQQFNIGKIISHSATPAEIAKAIDELLANPDYYTAECDKAAARYHYEAQLDTILSIIG